MTMRIDISPQEQAAYEARAQAEGLTVEQWLKKLAEARIQSASHSPDEHDPQTLVELVAPVRGLLTDDEIDQYFIRDSSAGRPVDLS